MNIKNAYVIIGPRVQCAPVYVCHIESHEFGIFECNNMVLCVAARDGIKNIIVSQPARGPLCHVSHYNSIRIIF